jgi:hypothetical protein
VCDVVPVELAELTVYAVPRRAVLCCQVMPQLLSFMDIDVEDPQAPDW